MVATVATGMGMDPICHRVSLITEVCFLMLVSRVLWTFSKVKKRLHAHS